MTHPAKRMPGHAATLLLFLVSLLAPIDVSAQEAIVPLQFSFSDPGARSMGFGGAFVALADDATAAFSNPAGLTQLLEPEISIEGRRWSYSSPFTEHGRVENLPSGFGIDTTVGLRTKTSDDDLAGLSFLSLVYPRENWSVAQFRHQYANLEFFSETQGLFAGETTCCQDRFWDQRSQADMDILSYGISAAYQLSDRIDIGLGVVYYDASFVSDAEIFWWDEDTIPSFFESNSYLPQRSVFSERISFDDTDWAVTAGFLWKLSAGLSVGGVYRQAPKIDVGVTLTAGQTIDFGVPPGAVISQESVGLEFPGLYGLGIAHRTSDGRLTTTFQWDRVEYSNIVDSLMLDDRAIDDVDELHLGIEYVFLDSTPVIAVRFGAWFEPDHQLRATSDDILAQALLPRGDDELHYAAGIGVAMQNFQIDLGVDVADRVDTLSLSAIFNF